MATALKAPIHKNRGTTMARINNTFSPDSVFSDINLSSQMYGESVAVQNLEVFSITGPHGTWQQYTFEDIKNAEYKEAKIGDSFGPTWTTHWFRMDVIIPAEWRGREVHLRWATGSENMIYDQDGNVIQGLSPDFREEYILSKNWQGEQPDLLYIEMACNHMGGAGDGIHPPDENKYWKLSLAEIAIFNRNKFDLRNDLQILYQTANKLGDGSHIGMQAMFAANEIVNLMRLGHEDQAGEVAKQFFADKTGAKAHNIHAMGNCHIDTAWLLPYDETIRKCARSFSAQLRLMEEYPDYNFVASSSQQLLWVKQWYPTLFEEIKVKVADGHFVPVGGCWVENYGLIPSGESFIRQFFYGQRFFRDEFKYHCKEFWLPDTFGYSANIPQIIKALWHGSLPNPKTGKKIGQIDMPTSSITSIAFGGPNLDILYVTSAERLLSEEQKATQPFGKSLPIY